MKLKTAKKIIDSLGGQAKFARKAGIPYRTIQDVYGGRCQITSPMASAIRKTAQAEALKRRCQKWRMSFQVWVRVRPHLAPGRAEIMQTLKIDEERLK